MIVDRSLLENELLIKSVASWQGGRLGGSCSSPLDFGLSENCRKNSLLVRKFSSKKATFRVEKPPFLRKKTSGQNWNFEHP